jgi:cytochrome c oxidase assembly factor CtaG
MWRAAGVGRGVRRWEAACFALGWLTLVAALVSPLHPWGSVLFSAHMVQHELLMLVAAPLLVLGRPVIAMLKAFPAHIARGASRWTTASSWRRFWGFIVNPFVAWAIHAAVLWIWHIPALFDATNGNDFIHALQHLSFVASALLFWWAVMHDRHRAIGYGAAVLYLFTTAIHSGLLGALITFAPVVWYPSYLQTTASWGLTPLEDQQIGGLIMWVPACLSYIIAGLALFAAWLRDSEGRVERWERSPGSSRRQELQLQETHP